MSDNDIDALLRMLNQDGWEDYYAALTALIAERDALQQRVDDFDWGREAARE